jgi:hypothetical protein
MDQALTESTLWIPFAINDMHFISVYFRKLVSFSAGAGRIRRGRRLGTRQTRMCPIHFSAYDTKTTPLDLRLFSVRTDDR